MNVPLDAPYQFATGVYAGMSRTVVRVTIDDGLVGLGESPDAQDAARLRAIAPDLVGQDAGVLCERLSSAPYAGPDRRDDPKVIVRNPLAAVEMALWDIAARSAGVPLCVLLGGPVRHEIAVTEYFAYRLAGPSARGEQTASQVAGYCARMVREHGSPAFEGKMGVRPLAEELLMLREVRNAIGPARMLRVDANMAWCPKTARQALIALDEIGVESVEEPVAGFKAMREAASPEQYPAVSSQLGHPRSGQGRMTRRARARHRRLWWHRPYPSFRRGL